MSLLTGERVQRALDVLKGINLSSLLLLSSSSKDEGGGDEEKDLGTEEEEKRKGKGKGKGQDLGKKKDTTTTTTPTTTTTTTTTIKITLKGLASMHSPSTTSILYSTPLDPDQHLQTFAQALRDVFTNADLLVRDTRPQLLLHATIVNTIYVPGVRDKSGRGGHGKKKKARLVLDVRGLLEDYEDVVWMQDVRLEKVAICRMGAERVGEGGEEEYVVEGEVDMPVISNNKAS